MSIFKAKFIRTIFSVVLCVVLLCTTAFANATIGNTTEVPGDVNGDGVKNLKDLVTLARLVAQWENVEYNPWAADVNDDGVVDLKDVTVLGRNLVGWNVEGIDREPAITLPDPEEKFVVSFPETDKFIYRLGNKNSVTIGSLFKAAEGIGSDDISDVTVSVTDSENNELAVYTEGSTWKTGELDFADDFTGIANITINMPNDRFCSPTTLKVEVVDAVNATGATNATENNVVLLNNIGSGFTISGRYTVYGNGFTLNYTANGQYLNNGLKQGIITITDNGVLDNLRVKATIYPAAYLYYDEVKKGPSSIEGDKTRYHYQLSAIAASGNATIQNCYIYGARNNIFVGAGNVTISDTVLECGTLSNIEIQSNDAYTVTLNNVTTIQHQVSATIGGASDIMLGAGVIVMPENEEEPSNPKIVLNGDFKQYNWVTKDDYNSITNSNGKMIIDAALGATAFNHTINGKTASNLGIIYLTTKDFTVENNVNLPYTKESIQLTLGVSGQVYSLQSASESQIFSDVESADRSTINGLYKPQFKFDSELGGQLIPDEGGDEFCYVEGETIKLMFPSGSVKELDLAKMVNIAKYTGQDLGLVITCKDSTGNEIAVTDNKVVLSTADTYTITYTVTDTLFYNNNGEEITNKSVVYSWDIMMDIALKDTKIPNAYFQFDSSKQVIYRSGNSNIVQFIPFLAGLKIYDYNGQTAYLRFDGDNDFNKIAKASIENLNTTGEGQGYHIVTIELVDGGKLIVDMDVRADSGSSTHSGSIKVRNNVIYVVNGGTTSGKGQTWKIYSYKFIGNNGTEINSGAITFGTAGVDCSTASKPSTNFGTSIKYTVNYDANGGNCGQTIGYATSVSATVTLPTPSCSGYIFAGWYTAASGGTRVGGAGESYTPSATITLYAQWGKPCTVTYDSNGGECSKASEKYDGTALILPTPTRDGYWFIGWYDAATNGKKIGDAGTTYNPSGKITLYAHWQEAIEYTVTYDANSGNCNTASSTYKGTALTFPTPTKTGHTFLGWYTAASGGTKIGDAGTTYIPSENITLYAQWQINSYTITVTTENATVKVNGTQINNNGTVAIQYGTQVTVDVTYSKDNNKSTTIKGTDGTSYTSPFNMPAQNVSINASSSSSCLTADTLVTLADGTQKRIDEVSATDKLLVWNFYEGKYDIAPIAIIFDHGKDNNTVIELNFSDGTTIKVVNMHQFFSSTLNKLVTINENTVEGYIGHKFAKYNGNETDFVELVSYSVSYEYVEAWGIMTAEHYNIITEGMITADFDSKDVQLFNYFVVGENMKFDEAKMQADIEKYGLYTYEDFADYLTYEQFVAFNVQYFKIAVGKGHYTFEGILKLIEQYLK